jgi:(S)-ureidoglycine aminohydrolase
MPQQGLVGSRAVVDRLYAILPPEGIPASVLPEWRDTEARILAAPAMGARFAEYRLDLAPGGGGEIVLPAHVEAFSYVLDGEVAVTLNRASYTLRAGGFAYVAPGGRCAVGAAGAARMLWLKKAYRPLAGGRPPWDVVGDEAAVRGEPFMGVAELLLKTLLPVDPAFDMAMNVFTFPPGFSLPVTETHVMEHGLYMLAGQGVYYLGRSWHEVAAGDFIWMGPYCPQSFYATGSRPARYLYYKDVHRDVDLAR